MILKTPTLRFVLFFVFIILLISFGQFFSIGQNEISGFLQQFSLFWTSFLFIVFYVAGTFFIWYLKDPLKIVGAVLFGAYLSTLFIYLAEIINAYIFFKLSRLGGEAFFEKKLKGRFKKIYQKIGNLNLGWIFLIRAVPLIPYRVLDLGFGLSKLSFKKYLVVVILASLPRIFWIQFILASAKSFSFQGVVVYFQENRLIFLASIVYFIFTLAAAFILTKKLKKI
ncbi:MAG: VTT domain-containing protein [Candidatus Omnitrophica bacterium]|nr:VTT domain-containing protein [Candidatus Omnitrophota bacterium]MCF7878560.1 VTT domain-containing protein [Candidatus Omnitrophota bacterium]